jgi:hypothetical protein
MLCRLVASKTLVRDVGIEPTSSRLKGGAQINNVIPAWLGRELLAVKNSNPSDIPGVPYWDFS